jgi:hypothetical protein
LGIDLESAIFTRAELCGQRLRDLAVNHKAREARQAALDNLCGRDLPRQRSQTTA